jgi:hypothetical protein
MFQIISYLGEPESGMGDIPKNTLSRARYGSGRASAITGEKGRKMYDFHGSIVRIQIVSIP